MFTVQISDRNTFVTKARETGQPVSLVRSTTAVPTQEGATVMMRPGVRLHYALEFDDARTGKTKWIFREVVLSDKNHEVVLSTSLWKMLEDAKVKVRILRPAGSIQSPGASPHAPLPRLHTPLARRTIPSHCGGAHDHHAPVRARHARTRRRIAPS